MDFLFHRRTAFPDPFDYHFGVADISAPSPGTARWRPQCRSPSPTNTNKQRRQARATPCVRSYLVWDSACALTLTTCVRKSVSAFIHMNPFIHACLNARMSACIQVRVSNTFSHVRASASVRGAWRQDATGHPFFFLSPFFLGSFWRLYGIAKYKITNQRQGGEGWRQNLWSLR